jgi:hypothetical protein
MSPRLVRVLVVVAALVALAFAWRWWRSPQRQVYRRLDALVELLGKQGEEGSIALATTAQSVGDFFAPGFLVRARPYAGELRDRQELAGAVLRLRGGARRLDVDLSDRAFTLAPDGRSAELLYVAKVTLDRGAGPGHESWRVRSLWIDDAGEWRISELELLERLEGGNVLGF